MRTCSVRVEPNENAGRTYDILWKYTHCDHRLGQITKEERTCGE